MAREKGIEAGRDDSFQINRNYFALIIKPVLGYTGQYLDIS